MELALEEAATAADKDEVPVGCVIVSLFAFALPEVYKPAELAYRYGLGALLSALRTT
jgi:hypothetical protein